MLQKSLLSKFLLNVTVTNRNSGDLTENFVQCFPPNQNPGYAAYIYIYIYITLTLNCRIYIYIYIQTWQFKVNVKF